MSNSQVAAGLWDFGEDDLADRAIAMSDAAITLFDGRARPGNRGHSRESPLASMGDLGQIRAALENPNQVWEL